MYGVAALARAAGVIFLAVGFGLVMWNGVEFGIAQQGRGMGSVALGQAAIDCARADAAGVRNSAACLQYQALLGPLGFTEFDWTDASNGGRLALAGAVILLLGGLVRESIEMRELLARLEARLPPPTVAKRLDYR